MVNRFLTGATTQGVSKDALQDASIDINARTLKSSNLQPNKNVITNGDGILITVENSQINPFNQTLNTTDDVTFKSIVTGQTEIKGDLILRNDDNNDQRARISGNTDVLTVTCDVLDLSDNLKVGDSLILVRSVIDADNPININGNNALINYKIINTRAGSQDKDILRYDQATNTFLFSNSLSTVENDIQLIETNKNFFDDEITITDSNIGTATKLNINNDSIQLLDSQNVPQIQISNLESIFGDNTGVVSLSDRVLTTPSSISLVKPTRLLEGLIISTGANQYEFPISNVGANDNDILIYNSTNQRLEFGQAINIFDQSLNTTDDVIFNSLQVVGNITSGSLNVDGNTDIQNGNLLVSGTSTLSQTVTAEQGIVTNNLQISESINNSYTFPSSNIGASDNDVLIYNSTNQTLEFGEITGKAIVSDYTNEAISQAGLGGIGQDIQNAFDGNPNTEALFSDLNLDIDYIKERYPTGIITFEGTENFATYTYTLLDDTVKTFSPIGFPYTIEDDIALIKGLMRITNDDGPESEDRTRVTAISVDGNTLVDATFIEPFLTARDLETTEIFFDPFEVVNNNDFFTDANYTFRYDSVNKQLTWRNNRDTGNRFYDINNVLEGAQNQATSTYVDSPVTNTFKYFGLIGSGGRDPNFDINDISYGQINRLSIVNELPGEPLYRIEIYYHNMNSLVGNTGATMIIKKTNNFI